MVVDLQTLSYPVIWGAGLVYIVCCAFGFTGLIASNVISENAEGKVLPKPAVPKKVSPPSIRPSSVQEIKHKLVNPTVFSSKPVAFLENPDLVARFREAQSSNGHLMLLTGRYGIGKTTFAQELCRQRLEAPVGDREVSQTPLYISLANQSGRLSKRNIEGLIAKCIKSKLTIVQRQIARKLLTSGNLLLFLDDLDSLSKAQREVVQRFALERKETSFVFLVSEGKAWEKEFPHGHSFPLQPWSRERALRYLERCLEDSKKVEQVLSGVGSVLGSEEPPLVWASIAKMASNPNFEHWFAAKVEAAATEVGDQILQTYISIIIGQRQNALKQLGAVALTLLTENRTNFAAEETGFSSTELDQWVDRLLKKRDGRYEFLHINYQLVLASKYIGRYFGEAREKLGAQQMQAFVWTTVIRSAIEFAENQGDKDSLANQLSSIAAEVTVAA